jgi:hypothetical protein
MEHLEAAQGVLEHYRLRDLGGRQGDAVEDSDAAGV